MATVRNHYQITGPVPFTDVDVSKDNRLFLDPHAIRLSHAPEPFASEALRCADTFFEEITRCVLSTSPVDRAHGLDLLQHFCEPWESRLGMSKFGFSGHGGADDIGQVIWDTLTTDLDAFVRVGLLRQLEDIALFVDGVDRDITSDIATRIMFKPLADFTADQVNRFAEFTVGDHIVETYSKQAWDPDRLRWNDATRVTLPVVNGKPLLLVPDGWARRTLLLAAPRFWGTTVLGFAQLERAVTLANGKQLLTQKDVLGKQPGLTRGRATIRRVTAEALHKDHDLVAAHKRFVARQWARANTARTEAA